MNDNVKNWLSFHGKGGPYFGIVVINFVLTVITFGLYYPWAKARTREYLWNETEFRESRFIFHGTGKEMFKGFVVAYALLIGTYTFYFWMITSTDLTFIASVGFGVLFLIMLFWFIPFAIFSSWRYRVSRTSWRGIYFSFSGRFSEYYKIYLKFFFISFVTFGLGISWFRVALQKYLISHTHIGSLDLGFKGKGEDLFMINFLGLILSYITIGLYIPVFTKNRFNFTVDNTLISDDISTLPLKSHLTGGKMFGIMIGNFFLLLFTLGLAFPFTYMRYMKALFDYVELPEGINYDNIEQDENYYNKATGDELLDIMDIDLDF